MPVVNIAVEIDERGVRTGFQQIGAEGQKMAAGLERTGSRGNVVFTQMRQQMEQSRQAARLLARVTGVEIPETMDRILAKSKLVGPALQSAFHAAVFLALAQAAVGAGRKVAELAADVLGYTRAIQQMQEVQVPANKRIVELAQNIRDLQKQFQLAGLEGVARLRLEQELLSPEMARSSARIAELTLKLAGLTAKAKETGPVFEGDAKMPVIRLTEAAMRAAEEIPKVSAELGVANKEAEAAGKAFELAGKNLSLAFGKERIEAMVAIGDQITRMREHSNKWIEEQKKLLEEKQKLFGQMMGPFVPEEVQIAGVPTPEEHARRQAGLASISALNDEWLRSTGRTVDIINQEYDRDYENFRLLALTKKITQEEFNQVSTRLEDIRTTKLRDLYQQQAEDHRQAVEQMANELGRFIDDPIRYIKDQWKKLLLTMVAEWLVSMRGLSGPQAGGGRGGGLGGIFGGVFGGGGGGGVFGLPGTTPPTFPGPASFGQSFLGGAGLPPGQQRGGSQQQRGLFDLIFRPGGNTGQQRLQAGMLGAGILISGIQRGGILGGLGGALGGAITGAQIGSAILPGIGTAIGAVIGAIGGFFAGLFGGRGKKRRQRDDLERQAFQAIKLVEDAYNFHQMDYLSARNQLEQIRAQVDQGMKQLGWPSRMNPHIDAAINRMNATEQERQRRLGLSPSPAIFHGGGEVKANPVMAAIAPSWMQYHAGGNVPAILEAGEFVVDRNTVARKGGPRGVEKALGQGEGGPVIHQHFTIQALDGASVERWLLNGGMERFSKAARQYYYEGGR